MDEARAAEMSAKSSAEIPHYQSGGTPPVNSSQSIHYEGSKREDASDRDEAVSCLKATPKKKWSTAVKPPQGNCLGCGGMHNCAECRIKSAVCRRCGKRGHLSRVCRATYPAQDDAVEPAPKRQKAKRTSHREDCFTIARDAEVAAVDISHAPPWSLLTSCTSLSTWRASPVKWRSIRTPPSPLSLGPCSKLYCRLSCSGNCGRASSS